jgi:transposase
MRQPTLMDTFGVGPDTAAPLLITCGDNPDRLRCEAAFASLCGAAPIPACRGKTHRHRLSRSGDRHANRALYTIALIRMAFRATTRTYLARRTREGMSKPEIMRCLKRYIARDSSRSLPHHPHHPQTNTITKKSPTHRLTNHRSIRVVHLSPSDQPRHATNHGFGSEREVP